MTSYTETMYQIQGIVNRWNMNGIPPAVALQKIRELHLKLKREQRKARRK